MQSDELSPRGDKPFLSTDLSTLSTDSYYDRGGGNAGGGSILDTASGSSGKRKAEGGASQDPHSHALDAPVSRGPHHLADSHLFDDWFEPFATTTFGGRLLSGGRGGGAVGTDNTANAASENVETTLVAQFDSSPATYSAEDAVVRLHVRAGSLAEGQVAGPIVIQRETGSLLSAEVLPFWCWRWLTASLRGASSMFRWTSTFSSKRSWTSRATAAVKMLIQTNISMGAWRSSGTRTRCAVGWLTLVFVAPFWYAHAGNLSCNTLAGGGRLASRVRG